MSYKPYLKRENPKIVVLTDGVSFDSSKSIKEVVMELAKAISKIPNVSVNALHIQDGDAIMVHIKDETPRYIELHIHEIVKGDPSTLRVTEVETFMRNYGINLQSEFDRNINLG